MVGAKGVVVVALVSGVIGHCGCIATARRAATDREGLFDGAARFALAAHCVVDADLEANGLVVGLVEAAGVA